MLNFVTWMPFWHKSVWFLMQSLPWKNITSLFVLKWQEVEAGWPQHGSLEEQDPLAATAHLSLAETHSGAGTLFCRMKQKRGGGEKPTSPAVVHRCLLRPATAPSPKESMSSWSQTSAPAPSLPDFPSSPPRFLQALPLHFVPPFQPAAHLLPPTSWLLRPPSSHPALICVSSTTLGPDPRPGKSRRKTHIHSSGLLGRGPECTKAKLVLIFLSLGQCC